MKQEKNKIIIGVTGGIGAGKSTVLQYIQENFPVTVLFADDIGKELTEPGKAVYLALVEHYGTDILTDSAPEQEKNTEKISAPINRAKLAEIALATPESIKVINEIEHPVIKKEIEKRILEAETPVVFVEAALLEEGGLIPMCKEVLVINASEEVRIRRLMAGRGYSTEKCKAFMARQRQPEEFLKLATAVIENNENFDLTKQQINEFMKKLE